MPAEILHTYTRELFAEAVHRTAKALAAGHAVVVPTETVYGLAANALDSAAVRRVFEIKGRPAKNPVIVHVADMEMARRCVRAWPPTARRLAAAFRPGPLTFVIHKSTAIPEIVTAGGDTVAVRWPQHPFLQAVIRECGFPVAAPSANLSNRLSPTTAEHAARQLSKSVALIIDGGPCQVGIESTVVDLTREPPQVLRAGMISENAIQDVLAGKAAGGFRPTPGNDGTAIESTAHNLDAASEGISPGNGDEVRRSPGLFDRHYAPQAKLFVLSWDSDADLARQLQAMKLALHEGYVVVHTKIPESSYFSHVNIIPHDPEAFARALYAELHRCDDAGAKWIVVEEPPQTPEWAGIRDRLQRATWRTHDE